MKERERKSIKAVDEREREGYAVLTSEKVFMECV